MNFTDVDDKIIIKANELGVDSLKLAEKYIQEFMVHLGDLNILPATIYPRATEEIQHIIQMIQKLIEKGYAYQADGDVYFFVSSDDDYGKLSGRKLEDMQSGFRIGVDQRKETPMDFALWKASKPGEPSWDSPWGSGRPGWHIECSAMCLNHLGEEIDIHGGGNDLIFPHHENEIAQTESLTDKPFSRYWVHNGMLQLSGEKMSKSIGNLITIDEFLAEHEADALRLLILNSNYRSPLTFNEEAIGHAERALVRLRSALRPALQDAGRKQPFDMLIQQMEITKDNFTEAMDDDFNTAGAMGQIFDLVRTINQARDLSVTNEDLKPAQSLLVDLTSVLGLRIAEKSKAGTDEVTPFIDLLIEIRNELRDQKQWSLSDQIRDRLAALNVIIEDGKSESSWHWK
jgi:cysteinyl-tRNA synthetase